MTNAVREKLTSASVTHRAVEHESRSVASMLDIQLAVRGRQGEPKYG